MAVHACVAVLRSARSRSAAALAHVLDGAFA